MSTASRGVYIGPPRLKIAIQAIVWLAKSGSMISSALIARQVDSHATFIRRVMQSLNNAGIVESKGGREGGYFLRKSSAEITIGDIYEAIRSISNDAEIKVDCGDDGEKLDVEKLDVELEKILQEAELKTIEYLRSYTIAQLMDRVRFFKEQ
ncbi:MULTISPECIES: RrF2 family transcriptional regulator [Paenibacillus]|nr:MULTISPECIES: Rrf2 family transcriptional regulator [Paenibacillus]KKD54823.1 transcriptional regulator [Paenibacillus sp. ICGEB2008]MBE3648803.1 Rrf2 family transcriptional regulator [Paenibacillus polymyxa]MDU8671298.1 Rrf2 family transcriptional regulator [Paenibacillus polymyxa]MDU8696208.1 Rrf2 family transcriptional regulator [Paenibacillus polymyxa]UNL92270.1 Rrf2 family transcriptional regulator [Paenibacillus polymyxa]